MASHRMPIWAAGAVFCLCWSPAHAQQQNQKNSAQQQPELLTPSQPGIGKGGGETPPNGIPPDQIFGSPPQGYVVPGRGQGQEHAWVPEREHPVLRPKPPEHQSPPRVSDFYPGSRPRGAPSQIPELTERERDIIRSSVANTKVLARSNIPWPVRPGQQLAASTQIHDLPPPVITQVPNYSRYGFAVTHGHILIVDPTDMRIINVIPAVG